MKISFIWIFSNDCSSKLPLPLAVNHSYLLLSFHVWKGTVK